MSEENIQLFNKDQKVLEEKTIIDNKTSSIWTYEYDIYGNTIAISLKDEDEEFTKINKYTFDKKRNWIRRIQYENDIPQYIIEREITYY